MKTKASEEAMRNFYQAVEPALIRIARKLKENDLNERLNRGETDDRKDKS